MREGSSGGAALPGYLGLAEEVRRLTEVKPRLEMIEANVALVRDAYSWGPELVALAEELALWRRSTTVAGEHEDRTSSQVRLARSEHERLGPFEDAFCSVVGELVRLLEPEIPHAFHGDGVSVGTDQGYDLLRYGVGQRYDVHVDVSPGQRAPRIAARVLSIVSWPVGGFEGGELWFPRQKLSIRPEPGSVVAFPSCYAYPHASLPVRRGVKHSIVTWLEADPRPADTEAGVVVSSPRP